MQHGESTPSQALMKILAGAWVAQAVFVAARLGIADQLRDGARSADELAAQTGAHAGSLFRVLRALASAGIFAAEPDGRFRLTPVADLLRSDAPGSLRDYAIMNGSQWVWRSLGEIETSVRTGQPAFDSVFGVRLFDHYRAHPEAGGISAAALHQLSAADNAGVVDAWQFPTSGTIVDIGGGEGSLLAAIVAANPGLTGVLFEREDLARTARDRFAAAGLGTRCIAVAGDFFDRIQPGADVYLMKKVIHDWGDDEARAILARCRTAMPDSARLLLVEAIVPEDGRASPALWLDLLMLVYTGGRERTEREYRDLLSGSGFQVRRVVPTAATVSIIEAVPAASC